MGITPYLLALSAQLGVYFVARHIGTDTAIGIIAFFIILVLCKLSGVN